MYNRCKSALNTRVRRRLKITVRRFIPVVPADPAPTSAYPVEEVKSLGGDLNQVDVGATILSFL